MKHVLTLLVLLLSATAANAKTATVSSPDGSVVASLDDASGSICLSVSKGKTAILERSEIALNIEGVKAAAKIRAIKTDKTVTVKIEAKFYRQSKFAFSYNTVKATLDNGTVIEIRACDEGIAYRYITVRNGDVTVIDETADYRLPADLKVWLPYSTNPDNQMAMAYQNIYDYTHISHAKNLLAFMPLTVDYGNGIKMTLTESELVSYPGMFIKADTIALALKGTFAKYPKTTDLYPWRQQQYVTSTYDYIAKTAGTRAYPWRIMAITANDCEMPVNNMVYALSAPSKIQDTSWLKSGKVAWDWWNDWGLRGVDFKAGINMPTYKKYIDFAAANGIQYVVLDEGWYESKGGDMLNPIPEIDVKGLVDYGRERNVGIVLWCVFNVLDQQLDQICRHYSEMGVKGFKVDFLDRDDQTAVEMAYRIADGCARYRLLLDYHGIYKPTGINRTYPNVLNFESVFGMEEARWTTIEHDMPEYDVTFPYIRLLAGYVDYTPGAMRNGSKRDWQANYYNPISQGTRCHQIATYIVYDSPFTMLCDSPSSYEREPECTSFICGIPTDIDQTLILDGKIGQYIVTARRHGDDWWIGGLTDWTPRDITVDMSFLPAGTYQCTLMADGINADRNAEDYKRSTFTATNDDKIKVHLASGGGFAIMLKK